MSDDVAFFLLRISWKIRKDIVFEVKGLISVLYNSIHYFFTVHWIRLGVVK